MKTPKNEAIALLASIADDISIIKKAIIAPSARLVLRKYQTSQSKDWNQQMAARLLGVSTRQLRRYAKNPPDAQWPGWQDPLSLRLWKNRRDDKDLMHRATANSLHYKEGFSEAKMRH